MRIINYLKKLSNILICILYSSFILKSKNKKKSICVEVRLPVNYARYLTNLMVFFDLAGYKVYIKATWNYLKNIGYYESLMFRRKNVSIKYRVKDNCNYIFSDKRKGIMIKIDDYKTKHHNCHYLPYSMHPMVYITHHENFNKFETTNKKKSKHYKLVFAGNIILTPIKC